MVTRANVKKAVSETRPAVDQVVTRTIEEVVNRVDLKLDKDLQTPLTKNIMEAVKTTPNSFFANF